jgi:hypothetical protein
MAPVIPGSAGKSTKMDVAVAQAATRRRLLTVPAVAGVAYTLSWIIGLSVAAPSPKFAASGAAIVSALTDHGPAVATQFGFEEGLPAAGLAMVSIALAQADSRSGAVATARFAAIAGLVAASISLVQFALGLALARSAGPGAAHALYAAINRLDGAKMLALAVLGAAGAASLLLPRWLRITGIALVIAIAASGLAYLLLLQPLALLAYVSGVLLLVFVPGTGIALGMRARPAMERPEAGVELLKGKP